MTVPDVTYAGGSRSAGNTAWWIPYWKNAEYFKRGMNQLMVRRRDEPIVPVMLGEALLAQQFSKRLFRRCLRGHRLPTCRKASAHSRDEQWTHSN
jgi:hypothetical protein